MQKQSNLTLFSLGGTGARPTQDGLSATGFPSGVGGVPTEVAETQAPIIQSHRRLRPDSGGPGKFRGGLGQSISVAQLGVDPWSVSGMVDRTKFAADGLNGGKAGALGEFQLDGEPAEPKTVLWMEPDSVIELNLPGGGGYGNPMERDPEQVLYDVVNRYVSIKKAESDYGVVIRFTGNTDDLVRLPSDYWIDVEATAAIRHLR